MLQAIPRHAGLPSPREFRERLAQHEEPLLFVGAARDWPALARWSFRWFSEAHGDAVVPVSMEQRLGASLKPFRQLLCDIDSGKSPSQIGHCKNARLERYLPSLLHDVSFPAYHFRDALTHTGLWVAPAGKRSPLHCDFAHNLNVQVVGRKRIRLCEPMAVSRRDFLRQNYRAIFAGVSFAARDEGEARGELVPRYDVRLEPGDMLFIPYGWWHDVESLTPAISVTRFWNTPAMAIGSLAWWLTRSGSVHRYVVSRGRYWERLLEIDHLAG